MKVNNYLINQNIIGFTVFLSITSIIYFSYIPILYVVNFVGLDKVTGYMAIMFISIVLISISSFPIKINKNKLIIFAAYTVFAMYAVFIYFYIGNYLDNNFTIRTITLVNVIAIFFALYCCNYKKQVYTLLFVLSGLYFSFALFALYTGMIDVGNSKFGNIFPGEIIEKSIYQNINTYLGLFTILSITMINKKSSMISRIALIVAVLVSVYIMFIIGGRSAIVSTFIVIMFYLFNYSLIIKKTTSNIILILFGIITMLSLLLILLNSDAEFFNKFIGVRRLILLTEAGDPSSRIYLFTNALDLFFRDIKTFLFGAGINSFPVYIKAYSLGMYPHNIVLELLAEYGIIGFTFFMLPIGLVLTARKNKLGSIYGNTKNEKVIFLISMYFWVIASFTGNIGSSWILIFFTFLLYPSGKKPRMNYQNTWYPVIKRPVQNKNIANLIN